ncbi:MAG: hypothetical protein IKI79_05810 [Erysipelotrichaceae bacterium]|nr:hypothetical protein [Erysipelotrichaceae bacterium]
MKKLLSVLLAVLMVFALVGCGQKEETPAEAAAKLQKTQSKSVLRFISSMITS